jgi:hypothetical protein
LCCNLILLFNEVLTTHFQPKTGIKLYEGNFKGEPFELAVKIKDGKLTCAIKPDFESSLNPIGEHAFDVEQAGGSVTITFKVEENKVTGLNWKNPSREIVLKKMEVK